MLQFALKMVCWLEKVISDIFSCVYSTYWCNRPKLDDYMMIIFENNFLYLYLMKKCSGFETFEYCILIILKSYRNIINICILKLINNLSYTFCINNTSEVSDASLKICLRAILEIWSNAKMRNCYGYEPWGNKSIQISMVISSLSVTKTVLKIQRN